MHPPNHVLHLSTNTQSLSLTCMASGVKSYKWERQGGRIPSGTIGANTNNLTFVNIQIGDAGNYQCVATNDCGEKSTNYSRISLKGEVDLHHLIE